MKCLVTGAAGFIGSHLCEDLLQRGHEVRGLDAFIPYYPEEIKRRNLAGFSGHPNFTFHQLDLRHDPLEEVVAEVEVVFHQAAMAGLLKSWTDFDSYWTCNVVATRCLLEAIRTAAPKLRRLVYVSTSSVYGRYGSGDESLPTRPISPYGVTKLAGEHLSRAYLECHSVPVVFLRYFSVYGPRQRPDMGYHAFCRALLRNEPVSVYGDGHQIRGNTYVSDCVTATIAAVEGPVGEIYNVGGGEPASVWDILRSLERISGRKFIVRQVADRPGDQRQTLADTAKMRRTFGWSPRVSLEEGLSSQFAWHRTAEGRC